MPFFLIVDRDFLMSSLTSYAFLFQIRKLIFFYLLKNCTLNYSTGLCHKETAFSHNFIKTDIKACV